MSTEAPYPFLVRMTGPFIRSVSTSEYLFRKSVTGRICVAYIVASFA